MSKIISTIKSFRHSQLFKDSFWAVFGNGVGNGILLISGIIIARFLGRDLYGEYGFVKTTMLYLGTFATLGLGTTSTKFIAKAVKNNSNDTKSLIDDSISISLLSSSIIAAVLIIFASPLARFLENPEMSFPIRILGIVIVFRSLQLTQSGILAGYSKFNIIAKNNIISSVLLLILASFLTYYFGLIGALVSLASSQGLICILNLFYIIKLKNTLINQLYIKQKKNLIKFSIPIALQDISYTLTQWGGTIIITKYSTIGQLGILNVTLQWNSIVLLIPSLLVNVILSHLSRTVDDSQSHIKLLKTMLICNFLCTIIPFIFVYFLATWISNLYGPTFFEMPNVLRVIIFMTVFNCCSRVFNAEFIAQSKTWMLFAIRCCRDILGLILCYYLISIWGKEAGAMSYAISAVTTEILYFIILVLWFLSFSKKFKNLGSKYNLMD
ncbi:MAG: oligosaccharide flippase family protein [Muribaculaceae bacterium]|nr:oligosaccharide flippase family protein [Muribaculaceae bacterium]